ncbi:MAG: hypothetical protein OXF74_04065 [Rhodobacteraceae bacterium]|nr:hypothetical protein [Paracoccaceae bacterium]
MNEIREYLDTEGRSPFARWFGRLDVHAAAKVATALARMEQGNFSNVKGVGAGTMEYRIDFGPGYRIYFGKDGATLVVLLGGGTKARQQRDNSREELLAGIQVAQATGGQGSWF